MEKLKKARVKVHTCPTCKGNGYVKVATEGKDQVHQCWDCDSEGEYYVYQPQANVFDNAINIDADNDDKLH